MLHYPTSCFVCSDTVQISDLISHAWGAYLVFCRFYSAALFCDMMRTAHFTGPVLQLSRITRVRHGLSAACSCQPSRSYSEFNLPSTTTIAYPPSLTSLSFLCILITHTYDCYHSSPHPSQPTEFFLKRKIKIKCGIECRIMFCTICPTSTYNTYAYTYILRTPPK